jgi:hypothetical protein
VDPYRVNISRLFSWKILANFMMKKVYQRIKLLDTKVDFQNLKMKNQIKFENFS